MIKQRHPDTYLDIEDTEYHLYIVNFTKLFEINIQLLLLQDLQNYQCTEKINKDTKAFFYHHIIHGICQYIVENSKDKGHKIIIYNNLSDLKNLDIFKFFDEEEVKSLIQKILTNCKKYLPVRIFTSDYSFYYFLGAKSGKKQEIMSLIRQKSSEAFDNYTFNKARYLIKKQNLTFLNDVYFAELKVKQMMFC